MSKGIIFSTDALMALAITLLIFSAISLVQESGETQGEIQATLFTKSSDEALTSILTGNHQIDTTPEARIIHCESIKNYSGNGSISEVVKKCASTN